MAEVTIQEIPITTDENSITIDENPVTTDEKPVTTDDTDEKPEALPADVVALEPKKKPGRPVGSKNKEPGKPRKPRAKAVAPREEPVPVEPPIPPLPDQPYDAPTLPGSRRIPTEARDSHEAMMLRLLSQQANARQQNKVALWKSWFH